jgi:ribosomal protein S18 acetylase RimI-like enzyme
MVRLVPMDAARFEVYLESVIRSYADENIKAGRWTAAEGLIESGKQIRGLLPNGLATPGQFLFSIVAEAEEGPVGVLWLAIEPRGGFIYDLEIDAPFRRRGFAEQAMRLAEQVARERGAAKLLLHVFGSNMGARRLYAKLGYEESNVMMAKSLPS